MTMAVRSSELATRWRDQIAQNVDTARCLGQKAYFGNLSARAVTTLARHFPRMAAEEIPREEGHLDHDEVKRRAAMIVHDSRRRSSMQIAQTRSRTGSPISSRPTRPTRRPLDRRPHRPRWRLGRDRDDRNPSLP